MGSQFIDGSGSWGSIGNSIAGAITGAPGTALSNINVAEHIKASRAEQIRKQAEFEATQGAGNAAYQAVMSMTPPESTRDITVVPQGPLPPSQIPADTPDNSGGFLPPYQTQESYLDPAVVERFKKEQPMFAATARAQAFKDPHNLPDVYARGRVGLTGVPDDPGELNRLRFLTKGDIDRSKDSNYVVVDPNDPTKVLRVLGPGDGTYSTDGRTKFADVAKSVGGVVMKTGDAALNAKPRTMFDDQASRQNALIDASVKIGNGVLPDSTQTQKLALALATEYPAINKVMQDAIGNSSILHNFVETMPPGPLKPLLTHIAKTMYGAPAPSVFPAVGPDGAPVPTATAAAPSVPPIYDPTRKPEQTILSRAPANPAELQAARALMMTRDARGNIETMMNVQDDADGNPVIPPGAYVPNWISQAILDKAGPSMAVGLLNNFIDPQAMEYLTNARAWIEPVLRIASGAVTPPPEIANYMQMFIPNANDNDRLKAQKLTRMRIWEEATSTAASANEAIDKILKNPKTDPEARAAAEKMRVRAAEAGTLTLPVGSLGAMGSARSTRAVGVGTPAVTAPPPPPPTRGAGAGARPPAVAAPSVLDDADAAVGLK